MASLDASSSTQKNNARTWECAACFDDLPSATAKPCTITVNGEKNLVCAPCLRKEFLSAQESETSFPVKWQTQILHPRSFPHAFDFAFIAAYGAKENEYNTPSLLRAYCDCGSFVAPMVDADATPSWYSLGSSMLCPSCKARWCLRCAQRCYGIGLRHKCEPQKREAERRLALGGLKRGEEWQLCPREGCGIVVELAEACNSMVCICGMPFCFVCGREAEENSEHWTEGGCPRWGFVGTGTELFDVVAEEDDEGLEIATPWERGGGELAVFDFQRWAWGAAMMDPIVHQAQIRILHREGTLDQRGRDLGLVEQAMHAYNPASHSGIDKAGWEALVDAHKVPPDAPMDQEEPLVTLLSLIRTEGGLGQVHMGEGWFERPPERIFNVAIAADREAGAQWAQRTSILAMASIIHQVVPGANIHPSLLQWPGPAVFDVGPGAADGESWAIRDMDMFNHSGLMFWRLGGNALLVLPGGLDGDLERALMRVEQANVEAGGQPGGVLRVMFDQATPEPEQGDALRANETTEQAGPEEGEFHVPGAWDMDWEPQA